MSDAYTHLMFNLDMDISSFKSSVSQVETAIKNVGAARKLAVGDEFIKLSETLDKLKRSLSNLNQVGLAPKETLKNVGDAAKQSRIALTSLSQVAQDLPFGFIGIQNNLPILLQSFQQLRETSTSNASALKALGQSLIGPGGVFLAFSIVTAGITAAIQKYGSLTEAISALSGKIDFLKKEIREIGKSFDEYNKALKSSSLLTAEVAASQEGQIEKVRILSGVVLDLSKSEHDRKAALEELKKLDKDRFGNYDIESGKLKGLTDDVINYTKSLIANAQANAFKDELSKTSVEIEKQKILIKDLNKQKEKLTLESKPTGVVPAGVGGTVIVSGATESAAKADVLAKSLNGLDNQIKEANKNIGDLSVTQNDWKESLTQSTLEVLKYATGTNTLTDAQEKSAKSLKESQDILNSNNAFQYQSVVLKSIEDQISEIEKLGSAYTNFNNSYAKRADALNKIRAINPDYFKDLSIEKSKLNDANDALQTYARTLEIALNNGKAWASYWKLEQQAQENRKKAADEALQKEKDAMEQIDKDLSLFESRNRPPIKIDVISTQIAKRNTFEEFAKSQGTTLKDLEKSFAKTQSTIKGIFFEPLTKMFNDFFTTGKFTIKDFGNTMKKMITEVAAKMVATGILKLFATLLNPAGAAASNELQNPMGNGSGLFEGLGKFAMSFLGAQMNPNFSGVTGGGTQMSGQVNMVLRGTDLVGSINRTNAVINRIG